MLLCEREEVAACYRVRENQRMSMRNLPGERVNDAMRNEVTACCRVTGNQRISM